MKADGASGNTKSSYAQLIMTLYKKGGNNVERRDSVW